jgi:hypothetical protein
MSLRRLAPLALLVALTLPIPTAQAQFEARALLPVPGDLYSLMAGDFNRDGIPDVAAVNSGGGVEILLGNGDGTFRMGANYAVEVFLYGATGSLRNNGILDLEASEKESCPSRESSVSSKFRVWELMDGSQSELHIVACLELWPTRSGSSGGSAQAAKSGSEDQLDS